MSTNAHVRSCRHADRRGGGGSDDAFKEDIKKKERTKERKINMYLGNMFTNTQLEMYFFALIEVMKWLIDCEGSTAYKPF